MGRRKYTKRGKKGRGKKEHNYGQHRNKVQQRQSEQASTSQQQLDQPSTSQQHAQQQPNQPQQKLQQEQKQLPDEQMSLLRQQPKQPQQKLQQEQKQQPHEQMSLLRQQPKKTQQKLQQDQIKQQPHEQMSLLRQQPKQHLQQQGKQPQTQMKQQQPKQPQQKLQQDQTKQQPHEQMPQLRQLPKKDLEQQGKQPQTQMKQQQPKQPQPKLQQGQIKKQPHEQMPQLRQQPKQDPLQQGEHPQKQMKEQQPIQPQPKLQQEQIKKQHLLRQQPEQHPLQQGEQPHEQQMQQPRQKQQLQKVPPPYKPPPAYGASKTILQEISSRESAPELPPLPPAAPSLKQPKASKQTKASPVLIPYQTEQEATKTCQMQPDTSAVSKPFQTAQEASKPYRTQPEASSSDQIQPEYSIVCQTLSEASQSYQTQPESSTSEQTHPEISPSDEQTHPESSTSDQTQPEDSIVCQKLPGASQPYHTQPVASPSDQTQPEVSMVCQTLPEVSQPYQTQPEISPSEQTHPEHSVSDQMQPENSVVCQTQPEGSPSDQTQPEVSTVCQKLPEGSQPYHTQPEVSPSEQTHLEHSIFDQTQPEDSVVCQTQPDGSPSDQTQPEDSIVCQTLPEASQPYHTQSEGSPFDQTQPEVSTVCQILPEGSQAYQTRLEISPSEQTYPEDSISDQTQPEDSTVCQTLPEASQPYQTQPEVSTVCQTLPESSHPYQTRPEISPSEQTYPEDSTSDQTQPEGSPSDQTQPEVSKVCRQTLPEGPQPYQTQPEHSTSDQTQPEDSIVCQTPPAGSRSVQTQTQDSTLDQTSPASSTHENLWKIPERRQICDEGKRHKGIGAKGKEISIEVNYLALTFSKPQKNIYRYKCIFDPDNAPKKMLRLVMEKVRGMYYPNRHPAFDGRLYLYSIGSRLMDLSKISDFILLDDGGGRHVRFEVKVSFDKKFNWTSIANFIRQGLDNTIPENALTALDIALRIPASLNYTEVGRKFFHRPSEGLDRRLGSGLELWSGIFQKTVIAWKPFLNVDSTHKSFSERQPLVEIMLYIMNKRRPEGPQATLVELRDRGLTEDEQQEFNTFITGLKVRYFIPGHPNSEQVYRVKGVKDPCGTQKFTLKKGKEITIYDYFRVKKNYPLGFPDLRSLHVGVNSRNICLPPELCEIMPGQVINKKLDESQTNNLLQTAVVFPHRRKQRILNDEVVERVKFNDDRCLKEFGIIVEEKFLKVNARVLNPPSLQYKGEEDTQIFEVTPSSGEWDVGRFLQTTQLNKWLILGLAGHSVERLRRVGEDLFRIGRQLGMELELPYDHIVPLGSNREIHNDQLKGMLISYFTRFKKEEAQLVLIVIPNSPSGFYSKVKLIAEVNIGVLTQCITAKTVDRHLNLVTIKNVLLKINAKLNGTNHILTRGLPGITANTPFMIVGGYVAHPSPDQAMWSVVGVAASYDLNAFQYNMIWRLQAPRSDIILDLHQTMFEQLNFYFEKRNNYPEQIIIYREGVSEDNFINVLETEISALRIAFSTIHPNYNPNVTLLVVRKNHRTRFFPYFEAGDIEENVPPGTVVDTDITDSRQTDFYMVSHSSDKGTSLPTKYHMLWDENNISEDDLQELTYHLCHLYSRCTRSVGCPAPTYYAQLAAARGQVYLKGSNIPPDSNIHDEMLRRRVQDNIINNSPMFFV